VPDHKQSRKVLVIDDDPSLLRMVRLALISEAITVITASDGLNGLKELEGQAVDLIVLDLQMPNMDGRTFYRELRSRGSTVPVIIMSAYSADEARTELGAESAISKPFDPFQLIRMVTELATLRA
jgi:CheY-like chemotaxis protein